MNLPYLRRCERRQVYRAAVRPTAGRRVLVLLLAVLLGTLSSGPRGAARPGAALAAEVTFTISVKSAFLRAQPSFSAPRAYSVFQGQAYPVLGRTADSAWLQLGFVASENGATWIHVSYGLVTGSLALVPVTGAEPAHAPPGGAGAGADGGPMPAGPPASGAAQSLPFTLQVRSAFARSEPSFAGSRVFSLFRGQQAAASGRSADSTWLRLSPGGGLQGWVPAAYGTLQGSLASLPVVTALGSDSAVGTGGGSAPTAAPASPVAGPILPFSPPGVSERARQIYQTGLALGNDARAFSKVGDCNSEAPFFLAPYDKGEYRLGATYAHLQEAVSQFAGSFGRESLVAKDGLNVQSVLDPVWANPQQCQKGESPLACEYRLHRPSLAFISLGTNGGWLTNAEYEAGLRSILDYSIERGVLPILSTKADNLEGNDRFNQVVRQLAAEYQLPLWDFAAAARVLPGGGLADAYHLAWGQTYFDTVHTFTGWQARNLTALQSLDAVWRGSR